MTTPTTPRQVVDLDALAGAIADSLQGRTYCLDVSVTSNTDDGFVRFDTARDVGVQDDRRLAEVIRATVWLVSDGEDEIADATGEVVEITVRRVTR